MRWLMWSRLRWISARLRTPRTVGIRPTAVYGSGTWPGYDGRYAAELDTGRRRRGPGIRRRQDAGRPTGWRGRGDVQPALEAQRDLRRNVGRPGPDPGRVRRRRQRACRGA